VPGAPYDHRVRPRERVIVYVERKDGLLVFDHRDHPEARTQVPAGGVNEGEGLIEAVIREVREETGVLLDSEPTLLGTHEHLDGLGQPARSHFFRVDAPGGLPRDWQHVVSGDGGDAGLLFDCRFDPAPELWPVQAVFRSVGGHS
jgi:8-oxo-dGTP pyrophosphatase MutT (NUDIX family)